MATLHDIAHHSGVSTATVSHVVNNSAYVSPKLRERVLKAIREYNYQPNAVARTLRTKASKTVGIFVPDIADPFFPALVRGAEDVFTHSGYTLLIGNSDNDQGKEERYYRAFMERRVDGLVAVVSSDHPAHYIQRHDLAKVPIVFADRAYLDVPADVVGTDNIGGSKLAVNHLIEKGYERIATITGPLTLANARDRLTGYRRSIREAHLEEDEALVREGSFDVHSGYTQARHLLGLPSPPDAIFVQNGSMTLGAFRAIQEAGFRCPQEIGVISFADQEWFSLVRPQITGVAHESYDIGSLAAELLLKRINGKLTGEAVKRNIAAKLVVRESTKHIPGRYKERTRGSRGNAFEGKG